MSTLWSDLDLFQESIQNYEYYESIHTKGFVKYKSREILGEVNTYAYFKWSFLTGPVLVVNYYFLELRAYVGVRFDQIYFKKAYKSLNIASKYIQKGLLNTNPRKV